MKIRQTSLLTAAVGVSILALTACSGGTSSTPQGGAEFSKTVSGQLNAWGFDNADEVGTSRLDYSAAELAKSDVTVKIDATPFDAQKFTTLAASGKAPDVVQMSSQFVTTYAAKGLIMPLDQCYSVNGVDPKTQYYSSVLADVTYDGSLYAVPQFYQPPAIMLNMRVLNKAGVTPDQIDTSKPDELIAAAKKMTVGSGRNITTVGFDPQGVSQAGLWMLGFGGQIMDADGKPTLDNENNVKAVQFLKDLYDAQGGFADLSGFIDSFDVFGENNQFVADQEGAGIWPQWYVNVLTPYVDKVDISAVPFRNSAGEPFTVSSGTAFVIPTGAKNPSAACQWALNLTSEAGWQAAGEARQKTIDSTPGAVNTGLFTGSPVADQSLREQFTKTTGNKGFDEAINTYYDVVGEGKSFGSSPAGQQIQTELSNAVTSALSGEKDPAKALADGQAAALRAYEQSVKK